MSKEMTLLLVGNLSGLACSIIGAVIQYFISVKLEKKKVALNRQSRFEEETGLKLATSLSEVERIRASILRSRSASYKSMQPFIREQILRCLLSLVLIGFVTLLTYAIWLR